MNIVAASGTKILFINGEPSSEMDALFWKNGIQWNSISLSEKHDDIELSMLQKYDMIFWPSCDIYVLSTRELNNIREYVRRGGGLLVGLPYAIEKTNGDVIVNPGGVLNQFIREFGISYYGYLDKMEQYAAANHEITENVHESLHWIDIRGNTYILTTVPPAKSIIWIAEQNPETSTLLACSGYGRGRVCVIGGRLEARTLYDISEGDTNTLLLNLINWIKKPRILLLANSIDYSLASDFFRFLENKGIEVVRATASDFYQYKNEKFIVILGGPDAYEGVGEIVREVLMNREQNWLRERGNRRMYVKTNVWTQGQVVFIIAGSDRYETQRAHEESRGGVVSRVSENKMEEDLMELFPTDLLPSRITLLGYTSTTELMFSGAQRGVIVTYKTDEGAIILDIGKFSSPAEAESSLNNYTSLLSPYVKAQEKFYLKGAEIYYYMIELDNASINLFFWIKDSYVFGLKGGDKELMRKLLDVML